jgi:hypothetical protein
MDSLTTTNPATADQANSPTDDLSNPNAPKPFASVNQTHMLY